MKVLKNKSSRLMQCHSCSEPITVFERYAKVSTGNYHVACLVDGRGDPIFKPRTPLERSRARTTLTAIASQQPTEGA